MHSKLYHTGLYTAIYGVALVLAWIGLFKFTPTEAEAIKPLIENSPFMGWLYGFMEIQVVSNLIGSIEILTALLLCTFPFSKKLSFAGGLLTIIIFLSTLSFLFTTPNAFRSIDGFLLPDAFILKDIVFLGVGIVVVSLQFPFRKK